MALALIGDFGTALVFFVCFLVISFMRSGSVATVMLAVTGAALPQDKAFHIPPGYDCPPLYLQTEWLETPGDSAATSES